ncbi:hypothetical protein EV424DRAFT_1391709 [Suillus variegatus]|nr:hypothetical protein EV424DRAFT_1391709 [Suillus variegatus]
MMFGPSFLFFLDASFSFLMLCARVVYYTKHASSNSSEVLLFPMLFPILCTILGTPVSMLNPDKFSISI